MPYPPISALPAVPSRNAPSTFSALMDAFLAAFPQMRTEFNALAAYLDTLALATGPGLFQSGSAALPGIAFAGDTDTGLFRPAANQIGIATGGTRRALLTTAAFQVDLPITGSAVTQSDTDATSGRLMKVGDFGLGVTGGAPWLSDTDATNTPSGLYRTTTSSLGVFPAGSNQFGHVIVHRHNTGTLWQTYAPVGNAGESAGKLWHRIGTATGWFPWRLVYDQGAVLGTVSQSGGVPTGALMQGNAGAAAPTGGWTERLGDGFQTVHNSLTSSASANTTWTYNSAFLAGSTPVITAQPIGDANYSVRIVSRTETACVFSVRDGADNRVAVPVDLTARGRWSNMT